MAKAGIDLMHQPRAIWTIPIYVNPGLHCYLSLSIWLNPCQSMSWIFATDKLPEKKGSTAPLPVCLAMKLVKAAGVLIKVYPYSCGTTCAGSTRRNRRSKFGMGLLKPFIKP